MIFYRSWWEAWKAWRRGEVRTPGNAVRGRVYVKREVGIQPAKAEPKAYISARVFRAATGLWDDLGVIAAPKKED